MARWCPHLREGGSGRLIPKYEESSRCQKLTALLKWGVSWLQTLQRRYWLDDIGGGGGGGGGPRGLVGSEENAVLPKEGRSRSL